VVLLSLQTKLLHFIDAVLRALGLLHNAPLTSLTVYYHSVYYIWLMIWFFRAQNICIYIIEGRIDEKHPIGGRRRKRWIDGISVLTGKCRWSL